MTSSQDAQAIAEFIRTRGVTRCPTACAAPTHGSVSAGDRFALQHRAERLEALRLVRAQSAWLQVFGTPAGSQAAHR